MNVSKLLALTFVASSFSACETTISLAENAGGLSQEEQVASELESERGAGQQDPKDSGPGPKCAFTPLPLIVDRGVHEAIENDFDLVSLQTDEGKEFLRVLVIDTLAHSLSIPSQRVPFRPEYPHADDDGAQASGGREAGQEVVEELSAEELERRAMAEQVIATVVALDDEMENILKGPADHVIFCEPKQ